ncbi:MAG: DUF4147 domain-containing protein [Balneolia bacterium]|nr:DUF4147 domain-containing protein [Balneolia bacterium]
MDSLRRTAADIFRKTLDEMRPDNLVKKAVELKGTDINVGGKKLADSSQTPVYVVGAGKAVVQMAAGLENVLGNAIKDGIVIAPVGTESNLSVIQVFEGTHPRPDEQTVASTLELMDFTRAIPEDACVFFLISGGASSLMEAPAGALELEEIRKTYDALLKSGATIQEMNTVRKQLSDVKGGKLLSLLKSGVSASLIISDVPGDDPAFIASGPTTPSNTSKKDALKVIEKFGLSDSIPEAVIEHLSVKDLNPNNEIRSKHKSHIIGSSGMFAQEAGKLCRDLGYSTVVSKKQYTEDAEKVAKYITSELRKKKSGKRAFIFHGESTVHVKGDGKGGRNQHLALLMSKKISRRKNTLLLSAGTDGVDGNTDVAGAFAASDTSSRAAKLGIDANDFLRDFNSYHFFKTLGDLIFTGPTGNNVMDFQLILIDA